VIGKTGAVKEARSDRRKVNRRGEVSLRSLRCGYSVFSSFLRFCAFSRLLKTLLRPSDEQELIPTVI
jgi:hypothetical protein